MTFLKCNIYTDKFHKINQRRILKKKKMCKNKTNFNFKFKKKASIFREFYD